MKIKNTELRIVKGDINALDVDAIVAVVDDSSVPAGEAVASAGKPGAKHMIQTSLGKNQKPGEAIVRRACANVLSCAASLKVRSLGLPALGYRSLFAVGAGKIMTQEVLKFIKFERHDLQAVIFCLTDQEDEQTFTQTLSGYVTHIQDTLGDGPYVTVDAIIEFKEGIILIERSNPPYGWALPGGFVDYGESLEEAVTREAKEETGMELTGLRQMHTYSNPIRDPRFHTISTVFVAKGEGSPQFGDDARDLKIVKYEDLLNLEYAFDHHQVIADYLNQRS